MNSSKLVKFNVLNSVKTFILISTMAGIVSLLTYITLGWYFAIAGMIFIPAVYLLTPSFAPGMLLKYYRARKLSYTNVPEYSRIIRYLSSKAGLPAMPELYFIPSEKAAAFATGDKHNSGIAISAGLMNRLTLNEMAAVLGHEISHIKNNDMRVMWFALTMNRITGLISMIGQALVLINLPLIFFGSFSISWLTIAILVFAPTLSYLTQLTLSRIREFSADMGSAELLGTPEPLISALVKIEYGQGNLFNRFFFKIRTEKIPSLYMTHPPTIDRIKLLKTFRTGKGPVLNGKHDTQSVPVLQVKRRLYQNQPTFF